MGSSDFSTPVRAACACRSPARIRLPSLHSMLSTPRSAWIRSTSDRRSTTATAQSLEPCRGGPVPQSSKDVEISQVPGEPLCRRAVLSDPGGPNRPRHGGRSSAAFRNGNAVGNRNKWISGLNCTAHGLAVYASQGRSPDHHARLATGSLARLWPDGICTRWVPFTNSRSRHARLLSSCQAWPGALPFPPHSLPVTRTGHRTTSGSGNAL